MSGVLESALGRVHGLFSDADSIGSLIDPVRAAEDAGFESVEWQRVAPLIKAAWNRELGLGPGSAEVVVADAAASIARAADLLSRSYTLVVTNVPYLKRSRQAPALLNYCEAHHPDAKHDLATSMLERILGGMALTTSVVAPHGWVFMSWYRAFRTTFLKQYSPRVLATLGTGAFSDISGEVVNVDLWIVDSERRARTQFATIDAASAAGNQAKLTALFTASPIELSIKDILADKDVRIVVGGAAGAEGLDVYAGGFAGICSGDYPRFGRFFWEVLERGDRWVFQQSTVKEILDFGGREHIFRWDGGSGDFLRFVQERLGPSNTGAWIRGTDFAGRMGVAVSSMGALPATLYTGDLYDNNTAVVLPKNDRDLPAIWAYCSSGEFQTAVREIDQSIKVTNSTFVKVPFDAERWRSVAETQFPDGLPDPTSNDATQWLFRGAPVGAKQPLQVAVARLLGFRWPDQEADELDSLVDADGIVCLPAVAGEQSAAERVRAVLAASFGDDWSSGKLDQALVQAGGKPGDLAGWLANSYFKDHCKVFGNRPFVWHIWDGRKDGFSALVNYHRLDRPTLEKLTYRTLGWWIDRQRSDAESGVPGADTRLAAAQALQAKLRLILEGEPPFDVYVRWKSLAEQPIGWEPDLDDGVRMNIRPFMEAGVLRTKPAIHWKKDRGTNPDGSERHNDLHYSVAEKRKARD